MDSFTNEAIDVTGVPRLDEEAFVALDRRYRLAWLGSLAVGVVVTITATAILVLVADAHVSVPVIGAAVLCLLAVTAVLWIIEFRRLGYLLREHDVSLRSGAITHRVATVPFARVQHVSVTRGPFERALGLATVSVSSAGPDISIPGLALDDAERIKQLITERSGVDDTGESAASTMTTATPWAAPTTPTTPLPPPER